MKTKIKIKKLKIEDIRIDGGTQPRELINQDVVGEYAELIGDNVKLPPVTIFFDGAEYWLADGFHRYWASRKLERNSIEAAISEGTQRDAVLYSVGSNVSHGLRRSNADKRRVVLMLLKDKEWQHWSDREISRRCGVSHNTVMRHRASLIKPSGTIPSGDTALRTFRNKHGKISTMNTSNIGSTSKSRKENTQSKAYRSEHSSDTASFTLPDNPSCGARVIIHNMGIAYARELHASLTDYIESQ